MRGSAVELAARYGEQPPKGEIVLVIGPARAEGAIDLTQPLAALQRLVEAGAKPRPAAGVVAELDRGQRQRAVSRADRRRPRRSALDEVGAAALPAREVAGGDGLLAREESTASGP